MAKSGVLALSSDANESLNVCFCAVRDLLVGNNGTSPPVAGAELSLVERFARTWPDLFMEAPSVLSAGPAPVGVTEPPRGPALRSVAARGAVRAAGIRAPRSPEPGERS